MCAILATGCASKPTRHWSPFPAQDAVEWHSGVLLVSRHDSDHDGTVTRRELESGLRQDFWQVDLNRDGRLDPEEVRAANQRRIGIDQSTAIPLIDWNEDGYVDFGEFANGVRSQFEQLDLDSDGQVTPDEFRAAGARFIVLPAPVPAPAK